MRLKKCWFSVVEIIEIRKQVNREGYEQDPPIRNETLNSKKEKKKKKKKSTLTDLNHKIQKTETADTPAPQNKRERKKTI